MIRIEGRTIGEVVEEAVRDYAQRPWLIVPRDPGRGYLPEGAKITYGEAGQRIRALCDALVEAGYGHGNRIACLLENRPEMLLIKLACNALGISWVPINPDYRASEIAYLLADSGADLVVTIAGRRDLVAEGVSESGWTVALHLMDEAGNAFPPAPRPAPHRRSVDGETEASLLYTSGTTGRPKGCIMSQAYELMMGEWYATRGGWLTLTDGEDRIYSPLPLFHVNTGIILFYGVLLTGNAQIIPERFSRTRWWREIRETEATGMHYLGVVIPVLMNEPAGPEDREHKLRWGLGAGVEPSLHRPFEERFGFPLVEVWGMTEMCRILTDCHEPRMVDTRAFGRPQPGLEVRVVDRNDREVVRGEPGEMVVRYSAAEPRKGAFSGYLNQPEATEHAWRGGWFHTGDTVVQDESGMLYFVDRAKNIIRRSGENIAAAEVEAVLQGHPDVAQVAVIAIADEMRDEEVMACIVMREDAARRSLDDPEFDQALAAALFAHADRQLAYFKAPGWIVFVDELPVTGTQKVLKHMIFREGEDPRAGARAFDLRAKKKRS